MVWERKLSNDTIEKLVNEYFEDCSNSVQKWELKNGDVKIREKTPSMVGLAVHLGVTKQLLYEYLDGRYNTESNKQIVATLTRAREIIESKTLDRAVNGDMPPQVASLLLSVYGYKEPQNNADITIHVEGCNSDWGK